MRRLKEKFNGDKTVLSGWCGITDPRYIETIAGHAFDAITLDMQHGLWDESSVLQGITSLVARGQAPMVRIPLARWDLASRVMDFGALAVIAPMINTLEDAKAFASACRFAPLGERSFGPGYAASLYGLSIDAYLEDYDRCSLALAMVETRQAYENFDDIISVEGIDGILIGPSDLSISFRQNRFPDPFGVDTIDVIKDIIQRCHQAGKKVASYSVDPEGANLLHELGVDMIGLGHDGYYLEHGIGPILAGLNFRL